MNVVSSRLKQLREENNYSQKQVAEYLEIDQSYLSKIEKGKRNLNDMMFDKICLLYNCTADFLLGEVDEYESPKIAFRADEAVDLFAIAKLNQVVLHLNTLREIREEYDD